MVFPPIHWFQGLGEDELPDHWITLPYYDGKTFGVVNSGGSTIGVKDIDTVKIIIHTTAILEGQVRSIHTEDDSTSYQNTSGKTAYATFILRAGTGAGTSVRHVKIWSGPTENSTTSATLLLEFGSATSPPILDNNAEQLTMPVLPIQNNHYLTIENVDDARAGVNDVLVQEVGYVVERG